MNPRSRIARLALIAATTAAFAASAGPAAASGGNGDPQRSDNAPGGAATEVDTHRPAGAGAGRKVG